jgi:hypothetical protein
MNSTGFARFTWRKPNTGKTMQKAHTESHKQVDWTSIATEFYDTAKSIRSIAQAVGISETAIRKHAKRHGWRRPSAIAHADERGVSRLAGALESELANVNGVIERSRRFVAAMIQLGAEPSKIAAALSISDRALFAEFGGEIEFHTGRTGG